jgi:hypothetical protein
MVAACLYISEAHNLNATCFGKLLVSQIFCPGFAVISFEPHNVSLLGFQPTTGHEGLEREWRYSSTLSLTSALDGGGWSTPRPGCFTPGKETRYSLYRRLDGPQGRSELVRKILLPPGFDPLTVYPVASRYTDYSIPSYSYTCPTLSAKFLRSVLLEVNG